jgi:hypothetical protein
LELDDVNSARDAQLADRERELDDKVRDDSIETAPRWTPVSIGKNRHGRLKPQAMTMGSLANSARLRHQIARGGARGRASAGVQSAEADFPNFQPPVSTGGYDFNPRTHFNRPTFDA